MQSTKRTRGNLRPFFLRSRLVDNRGRSRQGPPDPGRGNTPRNVRRTYPGQTRTNTPGPGAGTQSAGSRHTPTPGHVRRDRKGRTGTATGRARSRNPTGTPPEPNNRHHGPGNRTRSDTGSRSGSQEPPQDAPGRTRSAFAGPIRETDNQPPPGLYGPFSPLPRRSLTFA